MANPSDVPDAGVSRTLIAHLASGQSSRVPVLLEGVGIGRDGIELLFAHFPSKQKEETGF